jgi:hypothetical protein
MGDQPYWAARVADLGIGTAHDGTTPTTESLSAALRTVRTPETCARAAAVAGTIRTDGATVAASCCSTRSAKKGGQHQRRGADVGGRVGVGGRRRCHCRAARQPGPPWIARRRSALTHHRGSRSAWNRRRSANGHLRLTRMPPRRQPDVVLTGEQTAPALRSFC